MISKKISTDSYGIPMDPFRLPLRFLQDFSGFWLHTYKITHGFPWPPLRSSLLQRPARPQHWPAEPPIQSSAFLPKAIQAMQHAIVIGSATAAVELATAASSTAALASQQFNTELSFRFRTKTFNAEFCRRWFGDQCKRACSGGHRLRTVHVRRAAHANASASASASASANASASASANAKASANTSTNS